MNKSVHDNLDETRSDLIKEIATLTDVQFNSKPDMNGWSIAQVCHHLVLVEQSTIKAIDWGLKRGDNAPIERKRIDQKLSDRTHKWKAPQIVEPSVEPFEVQQIIELLNESRSKLLTFLNGIDDLSTLTEKSVKHPALGDLPLDQWIEQVYLHEQRHIEQIKELKYHLNVN
ncbi:DinB family protein [Sporosarcina sp. ACRSL]|uniref:DinB family protein n=1 Tax=Sporosarcina sp. ACRSL TaxID=2918215 RepID=UPI001EF647A8|nr:DinB family protein [Sporosarcina sp. ACRSL]MCG7345671.1 DinB family protein [Sporosarcina sp. ACRSL]